MRRLTKNKHEHAQQQYFPESQNVGALVPSAQAFAAANAATKFAAEYSGHYNC